MKLSIIVAIAKDGAIGRDGDQPFYIKEDLRHFKGTTLGHPIIMGRKTFAALPKGPLPGRRNIVISRTMVPGEGYEVARSLEEAIALCSEADTAYIIGGAQIYAQALPLASELIVTEIDAEAPGADTFFPPFEAELEEATDWLDTEPRIRFCRYKK